QLRRQRQMCIRDRNAILLGALLGGMMAVDLGGPINKAAYVFGTATLATSVAQGGSIVMAAVMAGGMVPPCLLYTSDAAD
ncbi:hypothetical protein KQJ29_34410, partial [Enterococcus sp. S181_ASV_20]|nr:hypothetical protein [Enterococcus sp. S181_ASV_20]